MEKYIIETFKNNSGETMYKLIEVNEYGEKKEFARLDYIQLKGLYGEIQKRVDDYVSFN